MKARQVPRSTAVADNETTAASRGETVLQFYENRLESDEGNHNEFRRKKKRIAIAILICMLVITGIVVGVTLNSQNNDLSMTTTTTTSTTTTTTTTTSETQRITLHWSDPDYSP